MTHLEIRLKRNLAKVPELSEDEYLLRRLVFMRHSSCDGRSLYGDDGEMHCHECDIDFVRDSGRDIQDRISSLRMEQIVKTGDL